MSGALCCAVLCCAVLCCAVLCCAVLCCAVLCCAVLCCFLTPLLLQSLDASTLEVYIQQLQDQFSKAKKNDAVSEDQQVWADISFCTVNACCGCAVECAPPRLRHVYRLCSVLSLASTQTNGAVDKCMHCV